MWEPCTEMPTDYVWAHQTIHGALEAAVHRRASNASPLTFHCRPSTNHLLSTAAAILCLFLASNNTAVTSDILTCLGGRRGEEQEFITAAIV